MKPALKSIATGLLLLILAVLLIVGAGLTLFNDYNQDKVQFIVPGRMSLEVKKTGKYTLWNDYKTVFEGTNYHHSQELPDGMEFVIKDARGQRLDLVGGANMTHSSGAHESVRIGYVNVEQPGPVEIEVYGTGEERVLTFSRARVGFYMLLIAGGGILAFLCGVGGAILLLVGFIQWAAASK